MDGFLLRGLLGVALLTAMPLAAQQAVELPARDESLEPEMTEVFQVGSFDGAAWETFGEVNQVAFDGDGNLYVMDRQNFRVVVVDGDGRFVRQFGTEGGGPGEWRIPAGMGVLADGTVVVADGGHRAFMVYNAEGEFSHAVSMGEGATISLGALLADPLGGAVFSSAGGSFSVRMSAGSGAPELPTGRPIERITVGSDGVKSVFYTAWQPPRQAPVPSSGGGVGTMVVSAGGPRTFEPRLHVAVLPDGGLAVVDSSAYAVRVVGPDGELDHLVRRAIDPVAVTKRIEEDEKQRQLDDIDTGEGPQMRIMVRGSDGSTRSMAQDQIQDLQRQMLEQRGFYPEIPVVARLAASPAGTIWLERARVNPEEPGPIDLFRVDGTYLGTVSAEGLRIPAAFGPDGLVAYIETDQFDVPTVRVSRLPSAVR